MSATRIPTINVVCLALIAGIFFGSRFTTNVPIVFLMMEALLVVALFFRSERLVLILNISLFFFLGGTLLYWHADAAGTRQHIAVFYDREVTFAGVVGEDPDVRADVIYYRLKIKAFEVDGLTYDVQTKIMLRGTRYPEYAYGDVLEVSGVLEEPPEDEDFSYKDYLARQGIYAWVQKSPQVTLLARGKGNLLIRSILHFKHTFEQMINRLWHEPESSLLAGLLLGVRRGFSAGFSEALKRTGTTHIIAISGYNISIIVLLLQKLMQRMLPRKKQLPFFSLGILLFTLLVGASASVVRAALMGWLVLVALHMGRMTRVTSSLLLASTIMLLLDPMTLWDLGFQLSFLATGGIIWVYPVWGESIWYERIKGFKFTFVSKKNIFLGKAFDAVWIYFWETLLVTLAAQALVLPVLLYNFGQLSLISPLVNLFVLFGVPGAMLLGFVAVCVGLVSSLLALPLAFAADCALRYIVTAIKLFARIPFAFQSFERVSPWLVIGWYAIVALLLVYFGQNKLRKLSPKQP